MLSLTHLLILLGILVLLFGSQRLPQLGSSIGETLRNFKKALKEPDSIDVTPKDTDVKKKDETKSS